MSKAAKSHETYKRVDVETASQGKLIVMMFNGAIQRAEEAKRQLERGSNADVHNNLIRAQDILGELRSALDMRAGEIAQNLDRVYEYLQHLLIQANIRKESGPIDECLEHLTSLRDTWQELFSQLTKEEAAHDPRPQASPINVHGNSLLNLEG